MTNTQIAVQDLAKRYVFQYPFVIPKCSRDNRPVKEPYVPKLSHTGYPVIAYRYRSLGIDMKVQVHQIVAYQKYGDRIFQPGLMCRHRDNNKTNFDSSNVVLGTALDNYFDNAPETLTKLNAILAAEGKKRRKLSPQQAEEIRSRVQSGETYASLAKCFGIAKATISYLVNYKTYRRV